MLLSVNVYLYIHKSHVDLMFLIKRTIPPKPSLINYFLTYFSFILLSFFCSYFLLISSYFFFISICVLTVFSAFSRNYFWFDLIPFVLLLLLFFKDQQKDSSNFLSLCSLKQMKIMSLCATKDKGKNTIINSMIVIYYPLFLMFW